MSQKCALIMKLKDNVNVRSKEATKKKLIWRRVKGNTGVQSELSHTYRVVFVASFATAFVLCDFNSKLQSVCTNCERDNTAMWSLFLKLSMASPGLAPLSLWLMGSDSVSVVNRFLLWSCRTEDHIRRNRWENRAREGRSEGVCACEREDKRGGC